MLGAEGEMKGVYTMQGNPMSYPSMPQRYEWHMNDRRMLNKIVGMLEAAYEETPNEKILMILSWLKDIKNQGDAIEEHTREQELQKAFETFWELPHAQRIWLTHYREKEQE